MESRIKNPAVILPDAMQPIQDAFKAAFGGSVPKATLDLVHLRASQINGCSTCVDSGSRNARKSGETDERLAAVAAWREAPYFTDAERAALALTEAATRLADRSDPVPDELWDEVAEHYDEKGLAALVLMIGVTNLFNRLNVATRQVAGAWGA
ncbi:MULTISPECIES: carboxymuconolactone decarboxylase family protein [unclassified Streptomyces]|uniref:carboxymuconolactone decarboxylase family protein n=1 Tax=unclassified Streptomyces TaxID=2593676 RepID=UPI000C703800|nr:MULTISPECIES: carboxymuconolactone decarboxylase family protein [unclassified Streptomyces]AUH39560.1 alkylhydroperoxidase [Streptomyces sp. CMB-StM0423]AZM49782.1 carboxymuconolactone decarboxylase family protein [Streptomyces sp. WAC 06738]